MSSHADVIVIGGGMVGLSTAYYLAREGARVILLQAGDIGGGSSAACAGRVQVAEGKLDPFNLRVIRDGVARFETLEEELGSDFEFRRNGVLVLINSAQHWQEWTKRSVILTAGGIPMEMLDSPALRAAEPHLHTDEYWGAAYAVEGWVNPFLFCWAYARAARRLGAIIKQQSPVTDIHVTGGTVTAVTAHGRRYTADTFAVMCGAWTAPVLRLAGVELPVHFTHAQAFVTEPAPLPLHNTIALANFYDLIHGRDQAIAVGFNQDSRGALIVTEAVEKTTRLHAETTAWGHAGMAADLLKLYPALAHVKVVRSWGAPTPFTPDEEPLIGWVPGRENLFVAAGFMQTITAVPIVSPWMARLILGKSVEVDLTSFSPARFS